MKKHNEGYSLVLVLVVLTLMSLVASFILSVSLKNLQSQTAAVNRMTDQYAAAGEIEKIVAQLETMTEDEVVWDIYVEDQPREIIQKLSGSGTQLFIEVYCGNTGIKCELEVTDGDISVEELTGKITIHKPTEIKYISYEHLAREVAE